MRASPSGAHLEERCRRTGIILTAMPTILRAGPYRLFFYSADRGEAPHVHVEREAKRAKFWLDPVRLHREPGVQSG